MNKIHKKLKQNNKSWVRVLVYISATQTDLWNGTVYKLFILCLQQEKYRHWECLESFIAMWHGCHSQAMTSDWLNRVETITLMSHMGWAVQKSYMQWNHVKPCKQSCHHSSLD